MLPLGYEFRNAGMKRKKSRSKAVSDAERFARQVEAAAQAAVREALLRHKRLGNPVADWQDNRVVWIQPEDIEIPPDSQLGADK
jgi:hypothetical protein